MMVKSPNRATPGRLLQVRVANEAPVQGQSGAVFEQTWTFHTFGHFSAENCIYTNAISKPEAMTAAANRAMAK